MHADSFHGSSSPPPFYRGHRGGVGGGNGGVGSGIGNEELTPSVRLPAPDPGPIGGGDTGE